jgi:hypothetical protein
MRAALLLVLSATLASQLQPHASPATHPDLRVTRTLNGARLRFGGIAAPSMQLFVVGGAGQRVFRHEHLERQSDGSFAADVALADTGLYMAFAEFVPVNGWPQLTQQAFILGSALAPRPGEPVDEPHESDGVSATIDLSHVSAGVESTLAFDLSDASPGPPAEAFIASADLTDGLHLVAQDASQGAHVVFSPIFPRRGRYKVWLIVQRSGHAATIPFVIDVN